MSNDNEPEFQSAIDNPAAYNAAVGQILKEDEVEIPSVQAQPDTFYDLPGGLLHDGRPLREVEVRELTGADEERIDRARSSTDPTKFINTLVACGTVSIGNVPAEEVLDNLLVGDRDHLLLAIREATYGSEIEYGDLRCPGCNVETTVTLEVTDIPVKRLDSPKDQEFEVPLRNGRLANVHLPTVADSRVINDDPNRTSAERNSVLLQRCVDLITEKNGEVRQVIAYPSLVRESLGMADRSKILAEIAKRMPGPRYDEIEIEHDCGQKIHTPLGLVSMFPGL